eukprot:scaffold926_cov248-Pinguiococcus_pyrenoidosus.AAC.15
MEENNRKAGFETTVQFHDEGTSFNPTCEDIKGMINGMTDGLISTVNSVQRVLFFRPLRDLVPGLGKEGPVIQSIIRESAKFRQIQILMEQRVEGSFQKANSIVQALQEIRPIYEFNRDFDLDEFKLELEQSGANLNTVVRSRMDQIDQWLAKLDRIIRGHQTVGILTVEGRHLKEMLKGPTEEKQDLMKGLLREIARMKCREQLKSYRERIERLAVTPENLRSFAGYVDDLNKLTSDERDLEMMHMIVESLYHTLNAYNVTIPADDLVQLDDLRGEMDKYHERMEAARNFREDRLPDMNQKLDMQIAKLNEQLDRMRASLSEGNFIDPQYFEDPVPVLQELKSHSEELDRITSVAETYTGYQKLFHIQEYQYRALAATKETFGEMQKLWDLISQWNANFEGWMTGNFLEQDVGEMETKVQMYFKESYSLHKKLGTNVTAKLKDKTSEFRAKMPILKDLGNPAMKPRHWEKVYKVLDQPWFPEMAFKLEELLGFGILDHADLCGDISGAASGEAQLEAALKQIEDSWTTQEFVVLPYRDKPGMYILGGLDEIFVQLEDNQVTLQTMLGNRFISGVQEQVEGWARKLSLLSETLDEWTACQRNWMYLETIFGAEDIQKQLPGETQKFNVVDMVWTDIMKKTSESPKVIDAVAGGSTLLGQFQANNLALEEIQKSLEDYLETKRMAFPRFYFLSNDELLEILSQTRDPHAVQPHMGKCFDAIKEIKFGDTRGTAHNIYGFADPGGEYVSFVEATKAEGAVEFWLKAVEDAMRQALYQSAKHAYEAYPKTEAEMIDRASWLWAYPAQIVLVVDQIYWTMNCALALEKKHAGEENALKDFLAFSVRQIDAMVDLVRSDLSKQQRTMMGALITIDVHARDVMRAFVAKDVSSTAEFEWTKQLRYYWDVQIDNILVRQTNTHFVYGYEYLGNNPRLVITPLTDLCYMTLTGALHMRLGGAPAGPAGTGKTETTKDLAKALANLCIGRLRKTAGWHSSPFPMRSRIYLPFLFWHSVQLLG